MKKMMLVMALLVVGSFKLKAQSEAELKAWQEYMTPGAVHNLLASAAGEWTDEITMWMSPGAAEKAVTTTTTEMIMGGRYQVSKTAGMMMGMAFEGMNMVGYDNTRKVFTSVWVDNLGTGTLAMEGVWLVPDKSITFKGKMLDPMTGKETLVRQVLTMIDKDHQQVEMFDTKDGKETKSMEMKSTRKR